MKTLILTSLPLLLSLSAQARPAGGSVVHQFACNGGRGNVQYSLEITTQALPPQYSVRGITLLQSDSVHERKFLLDEYSQDADTAVYGTGVPELPPFKVTFDKVRNVATIGLNGRHEATCSEIME